MEKIDYKNIFKKIKDYFSDFTIYRSDNEIFIGIIIVFLTLAISWVFVTSGPHKEEIPFSVVIEKGLTLKQIGQQLKDEKVIRSRTIFNILVIMRNGDSGVISGEYLFHENPSVFEVSERLTNGDYGIEAKKIRVPEGVTIIQIGQLFEQEFLRFDKEAFYQLAEGKEGRLFPDTYAFLENVKAHEVLNTMEETFERKMREVREEVGGSSFTEKEIIIMASIVEREAGHDSKQEVSNILWKRISIGMALQVDATFVYERGKGTFDLTKADLKEDSPYNTYTNLGLPPTAISNPGFESLRAAAKPEETPYLYFLTGHDGEMYYAESFEGHKRNKERYLY